MIRLVGIGPGQRGLLTVGALEAMAAADVVLHGDALAGEIRALVRQEATFLELGADAEANARATVGAAAGGASVVRLFGGDVLSSRAGGAEARALYRLGVAFEVIPGIPPEIASATPGALPLFGRRILVTRARAQAQGLVSWLEAQGAEPIEFPAIRIVPPPDPAPLAEAAATVADFDWLVLTSVNGVERFWEALQRAGLDARALGGVRVAAIGPATASALESRGVRPDVVPERYIAEAVVEAMAAAADLRGAHVLLPRARGARDVLPVQLAARGATVSEVEAYRSVPDAEAAGELRARLASGQIDAVTFTSSSTVRNFVEAVGTDLGRAIVACIGPVTAESAREAGLPVSVVATEYTIPGLALALQAFLEAQPLAARRDVP